jgi:betaine-aldehyde dehydrogenase
MAEKETSSSARPAAGALRLTLPEHRDLYYGGAWHAPLAGRYVELTSPGDGSALGRVPEASPEDVDAAVAAARKGFRVWSQVAPLERARTLRRIAEILRAHAEELALIDAADCGNPVREMVGDAQVAAAQLDFFAGLVTEMKGFSIPMGSAALNFSVREPLGVVARIIPFNHPLMFCAGKSAAALAAGNAVIVKPPEQAPLSSLRFAELIDGVLPAGALNIVPGGRETGAALASHPGVAKVALIGSVPTGRAVLRAAADTIKRVSLELGGKNALIVFADADPAEAAAGIVAGMNFTWCGQSCGSTSRAFVHASIYDAVVKEVKARCAAYKPGAPTEMTTTMGALASKAQYERTLRYIEIGRKEGARLVCGGGPPADPALKTGLFVEPTVFADVTQQMTIAKEEIFGPVLCVLKWSDVEAMLEEVNSVGYGLTCSIFTRDLDTAYRTAMRVEAGYVWINEVGRHFLGAPFGGYKQSGMGREECIEELLGFTQEKNIHVKLRSP